MKNILIVEDDKALAAGIVLVLRQDGFSFQCCHNVKDAKKAGFCFGMMRDVEKVYDKIGRKEKRI